MTAARPSARRAVLALLVLILAATAMLTAPQPAHALGNLPGPIGDALDCKAPAPFTTPADGPAAFVDPGPDVTPAAGDAFASDPKPGSYGPFPPPATSLYEQYGYGGQVWIDYDPGCKPRLAGSGTLAVLLLNFLQYCVAGTVAITRVAFNPGSFTFLDPITAAVSNTLGNAIFLPFLGLALVGLAILVVGRLAPKGKVAEAATTALWAIGLIAAALATIIYPTVIGPQVDTTVTGTVATATNTIAGNRYGTAAGVGDANGAVLDRGILYETWLSGNFGRSNGDTALEYGPELLKASTINRADLAAANNDPKKLADLQKTRAEEFAKVADEIKEADPGAYAYLAGNHNDHRLGYAALGFISWLASGGYVLLASLFLAYSLIVVRGAIAIFPFVALLAIFPAARSFATRLASYAFGAVIAAVGLGIGASVVVRLAGDLLSPGAGVAWPWVIVTLLLIDVAFWKVTKPLRQLKALGKKVRRSASKATTRDGEKPLLTPETSEGFYTGGPQPAEGFGKATLRTALTGAIQGTTTGLALGAVTGGTSIPVTAATTAAKTAATRATTTAVEGAVAPLQLGAVPAPAPAPAAPLPGAYVPEAPAAPATGGFKPGDNATTAAQAPDGAYTVTTLPDAYTPPAPASTNAPVDVTKGAAK